MDQQHESDFAPEDKYLPDPFPKGTPGYTDVDLDDNDLSCSGLL